MSKGASANKGEEGYKLTGRIPASVLRTLDTLTAHDHLRNLPRNLKGVDFHSNDYLGLARSPLSIPDFHFFIEKYGGSVGATGSRLISGNRLPLEEFEHYLASFHDHDAALLCNSGFEANTALMGSLGTRKAVFIYDEYAHASIREGLRVGFSKSYSFRHNDLEELQQLLKKNQGDEVYVVVESLYSMDGDTAPLQQLVELCERFNAFLLVDEAHATGVYGAQGEGLVQSVGLSRRVFARVHTFGKAIGFRGACIVGSQPLIDLIINKGRSFIYSTAPDLFSVWWARELYQKMRVSSQERAKLFALSRYFHLKSASVPLQDCRKSVATELPSPIAFIRNESPIQGVLCPGNKAVLSLEYHLKMGGFAVKAIRSPTVPRGKERIRVSLHSFNSEAEIDSLIAHVLDAYVRGVVLEGKDGE